MPGVDNEQTFMSSSGHLNSFVGPDAVASLRKGYFGWQWVEKMEPAIVVPQELLEILDENK